MAARPPVRASPPELDARCSAQTFARLTIAACMAQVSGNVRVIEAGGHQAEHVHQLRVGLRRLRTALEELAELDAGIDVRWLPPLARAFRALGLGRDRQMVEGEARRELLAAGAPPLPAQAPGHAKTATAVLGAAAFRETLGAVAAYALREDTPEGQAFPGTPQEAMAPRLDRLHRRLRRDAERFAGLDARAQHRARKRLKRLRYLAEFAAPLFHGRHEASYFDRLRPAQEALGRLNDCAVALAGFRAVKGKDPGKWFAIGWLEARRRACVDEAAKALVQAGKAQPFWP
jgi:CHAD domain-containing protein